MYAIVSPGVTTDINVMLWRSNEIRSALQISAIQVQKIPTCHQLKTVKGLEFQNLNIHPINVIVPSSRFALTNLVQKCVLTFGYFSAAENIFFDIIFIRNVIQEVENASYLLGGLR